MTQAVTERTDYAEGLEQLLTYGYEDEQTGQYEPGLLSWYPMVAAWTGVRNRGRGGSAGGGGLPLNSDALDFCSRSYWANRDMTMPTTEQAQNPDNYRPGFEVTVLALVDEVRRAYGDKPLPRERGAGHGPRPDVEHALGWIALRAHDLVADHPALARRVYDEAVRLLVHVRAMYWGNSREATHSQCPHCHQVESVISDGERAVCITPICRRGDGTRYCWQLVDGTWQDVPEPDVDGRGQVGDDEVARWGNV